MTTEGYASREIPHGARKPEDSVAALEAKLAAARAAEAEEQERGRARLTAIEVKREQDRAVLASEIDTLVRQLAAAQTLDRDAAPNVTARNAARAFLYGGETPQLLMSPDPKLCTLADIFFRVARALQTATLDFPDLVARLDTLEIAAWAALVEHAQWVADPAQVPVRR